MWETKLAIKKERQRKKTEHEKGLVSTTGQNDFKSIKYSYLAVDAALCVILSCVRDATYDMPFPSAPRSKTCGNSATNNICPCPIKFGVFFSALNSHLTNEICQVHVCKIFQPRLIVIFS